jgi:hypothetical protein
MSLWRRLQNWKRKQVWSEQCITNKDRSCERSEPRPDPVVEQETTTGHAGSPRLSRLDQKSFGDHQKGLEQRFRRFRLAEKGAFWRDLTTTDNNRTRRISLPSCLSACLEHSTVGKNKARPGAVNPAIRLSVNLSPVADPDQKNDHSLILNLGNDAIGADPISP